MQMTQGTISAWMLWIMLAVGAALVLVSLLQTSERFWHWKRARQMHAGEVVPAADILRIGQMLKFDGPETFCLDINSAGQASSESESDSDSEGIAHVSAMTRGLLWFALGPKQSARRYVPCVENLDRLPQPGDTLALTVTGEDALYCFEARVREIQHDPAQQGIMLISVKMPVWLARRQRRQYVRVPLQLRAGFRSLGADGTILKTAKTVAQGTSLDLSGGGLRVELEGAQSPNAAARLCEELREGELLEVTLDSPLLREETLRMVVRECRRVAARGGLGVRLRGEFVDLPTWQRETLISMVFHAQRAQRRQSSSYLQAVI